jgi:conjugal transfer pilus assembly protein TraK
MINSNSIFHFFRGRLLPVVVAQAFLLGGVHAQEDGQQQLRDEIEITKPSSTILGKSKLATLTSAPNAEVSRQPKVKIPSAKPVRVLASVDSVNESNLASPEKSTPAKNDGQQRALGSDSRNIQQLASEVKPTAPPPDPRVSKILETPIPGVGSIPGVANAKNNVVRVGTERNEVVYIAANFPNRIATSFKSPKALGKQGDNEEIIKRVGSSLYVTPMDLEPIAIFVIGDKPSDPVFSLTLVPKDLPAQTIIAQLDSASSDYTEAKGEITPSSYVEKINYLLKQTALGKTPEGYTVGSLPKSVARGQYLSITPQVRYSGSSYDIYRYLVTATGDSPLELKEDIFYTPGVRAIGFFPKTILQKGEESYVFLIHQRESASQ